MAPAYAPEMPGRLAEAAFRLFSERGIRDVNMEAIAAGAGVTKGSLYWHYRSKDEVIRAACSHYYREWHRRTRAVIAGERDAGRRLEKVVRLSVRECLLDEGNRVFTLDVFALSLRDSAVREGWRQFFDAVREFYVGLVEDARAAGQVRADDPGRAVGLMLSAMEGFKLRALFEPGLCAPESERTIGDELLGILGAGPGSFSVPMGIENTEEIWRLG